VVANRLSELADRHRLGVALRGVGDPVVPQRVVEGNDPAGLEQAQRLGEVLGVLGLVAVAEDQVVVAVGEAGEHVERGTRYQPHPLRLDAGLGERLLREPLVLRLRVHRGEHAVRPHAAQHPDPRDTGAGADHDDRPGLGDGCEEPEGGAAAGADRDDPDLLSAAAGGGEDIVLGDELLGVGPARRLQSGDDDASQGRARVGGGRYLRGTLPLENRPSREQRTEVAR
jgi:hypothetical protein